MTVHEPSPPGGLPETPVERWGRPLMRFLLIESTSAVLLIACTVVAVVLANSSWSTAVAGFWATPFHAAIGEYNLELTLLEVVNDGLMTLFFFVIGLEIKRELVHGDLRDPRRATLPVVAALGGMLVPAGVYLLVAGGGPGQSGWGVPVATDIAFVAGLLALFGSRVPVGLKVVLVAMAIVDDVGTILLVAFVYASGISWLAVSLGGVGLVLTWLLARIGVRSVAVYVVVGFGTWLAFVTSGLHPTVAGVLLGLLTPAGAWVGAAGSPGILTRVLERLVQRTDETGSEERRGALNRLAATAREGISPLQRLETGLHPWVAFGIMPVFALANAGVVVDSSSLGGAVSLAVVAGLVIGKPLGIVLFAWLATWFGFARLPESVNWRMLLGGASLAGIGFTMSIFVAGLALPPNLVGEAKMGTLLGSTASAVLGCTLLWAFLPRRAHCQRSSPPDARGQVVDEEQGEEHWHGVCGRAGGIRK